MQKKPKMQLSKEGQEVVDGCVKQPYLSMFKTDINQVIDKISLSTCH
jgi:hypothetical protein